MLPGVRGPLLSLHQFPQLCRKDDKTALVCKAGHGHQGHEEAEGQEAGVQLIPAAAVLCSPILNPLYHAPDSCVLRLLERTALSSGHPKAG